ncbi:hypothetical protein CEUSTIGMA_g13084.t1 [Chlamydomonas eustigma]|uniref:FCP1 homology domain-containing protein n=1 Tax=Chlamydomonas eustigma TaxID=1157962 RepID=A0A250XRV1_9CHLO|nr:hypothetical protein CEUSTIGMA_g13084.t1 [Chlamydomonas eustigma]|eukprot:GAX85669.1 hypothetical protein CEUSTIGMA_g13084.t1 [Chlamydomonas eustigma]
MHELLREWSAPRGGLVTHTLLDGGCLHVPEHDAERFLDLCASFLQSGRTLRVVERCGSLSYRMFADFDISSCKDSCEDLRTLVLAALRRLPDDLQPKSGQELVVLTRSASSDGRTGAHVVWPEDVRVTDEVAAAHRSRWLDRLLHLRESVDWARVIDGSVYRRSGLRMAWSRKKPTDVDSAYAPTHVYRYDRAFVSLGDVQVSSMWLRRCSLASSFVADGGGMRSSEEKGVAAGWMKSLRTMYTGARFQREKAVARRVVLLDLDGTLIGDLGSVLAEHTLLTETDAPPAAFARFRSALISRLRYGIVRPHVAEFCRSTSSELFVYTASTREWASFIVPCIEAAIAVRFNRPIFSRDNCSDSGVTNIKSLSAVAPLVHRSLRRRYPGVSLQSTFDSLVLVDNTADVLPPLERSKMILCPTYKYVYDYDVLSSLPVDLLHSAPGKVAEVLVRAGFLPASSRKYNNLQQLFAEYYTALGRRIAQHASQNSWTLAHDRFFLQLGR